MQVVSATILLATVAAASGVGAASTMPAALRGMPLPAVAVGLLIDASALVELLRGRPGGASAPAVFSRSGDERSMYLIAQADESPAEPRRVYVADDPRPKTFPRVVPATTRSLTARGILGKVALVEVEVNGGAGSAALPLGEAFVATTIRRLDRTREYPVDAERVAVSVVERCRAEEPRLFAAMNARLATSPQASPAAAPTTRQREVSATFTWLEQAGRIRGECVFALVEQEERFGRGIVPGSAERPPLGPGLRYGQQLSVVSRLVFEADKAGRLGTPEEVAPVVTIVDRPPPGGGGQRS